MKTFKVSVEWVMTTVLEVKAETIDDAMDQAEEAYEKQKPTGEYLGDSFVVNEDVTEELNDGDDE